jgi:hypothetical protein
VCPSLDNEFLNDAFKAVALTITHDCIDVVAAIGTHFPRSTGEEYQLQIGPGERTAVRKQLALSLDAGRRGRRHEVVELVCIRKSEIDRLHAAH